MREGEVGTSAGDDCLPAAHPGDVDADAEAALEAEGDAGWARIDWYASALLLVISLVLVGLHNRAYPTLSPIDELQHIDYVIRAGEFDIPVRNERVGFDAMREAACRSVDAPGYRGPPCGLDEYDPNDFQELGFNTAASQFPPYYVVTGVATRALTAIGVFESKVTAARTLGALWAAAAWSVTWYLMGMLRIRRRHRALVVLLLVTTPLIIFHASSTVNADVSLMLSGAVAVVSTMKYEAGRLRWWWLPAIYTGLFFVEATSILAIAACSVYLFIRRAPDRTLDWPSRLAPVGVLVWLFLLQAEIADRLQRWWFPAADPATTGGSVSSAPMFTTRRVTEVSVDRVIQQLPSTFTPVSNPYLSPPLASNFTLAGIQLTNWLFISLLFAAAFLVLGRASVSWWARVTVVALLAAGPFYTFYFAYFSNADFNAPARFALPLVPLMAAVAATSIRTRSSEIVVISIAAATAGNTMYQLLTA